MFTLVLYGTSNAIGLLILWRAVRNSALGTYSYFYAYIASTLTSLIMPVVYLVDRPSYNLWYWPIQFVTLVFGCGVVVEIFRHVLAPYPGAEKFAKAAAFAAFGALFFIAIVYMMVQQAPVSGAAGIALERNVRALQAIFLFAVLAIIFGYRIPVGRNILGMIVGYGTYIAISLISRAVEAYASEWLKTVWLYIQPFSFIAALAIWMIALWSYSPNPIPDPSIQVEADYEVFVSRTRRALRATRSYLSRAVRP
jgi:hypothetical protein